MQKRVCDGLSKPFILVDLKVANTKVISSVEVDGFRDSYANAGLSDRVQDGPLHPWIIDADLTWFAVEVEVVALFVGDKLFHVFEDWKHVFPMKIWVSSQLSPILIILDLTPHRNHAVHCCASADELSSGLIYFSVGQKGLTLCLVAPVGVFVIYTP